ncbi:MAG: ComF family protein [Deltaproteobacteria bacterium]|nr:ComF family protein [Deltaproteobacteria bacterium]
MSTVHLAIDAFLPLFFPERCPACDQWMGHDLGLCESCSASLYPLGVACPTCAEPQDIPRAVTCLACRTKPPPFRRVLAPWRYGGELAVAIRRLKYGGPSGRGLAHVARPLGALLASAYEDAVSDQDIVVPVPLHAARLRARGFSQAQRIAEAARKQCRLAIQPTILPGILERTRATREQAGLSRAERRTNTAGAFLVPPRQAERVRGKNILVVDDVVTTTATSGACARALLAAGATRVDILALARADN